MLRDDGLKAPLQVYRALDKLVERGLAHRLESLNAFVACRHASHEGETAVFAICNDCGTVSEFDEPAAVDRLAAWARKAKFAVDRMTLELRGRCRECIARASR